VAIVGGSGSGKSTLAALLLGLHVPTSGTIAWDGDDLAGLEARSLRRQLGIVTQDPYLFGVSVRENIAMNDPDAGLDAVVRAAELACIHDDIVTMPMGYETVLAEGGASLSGGQRQRVAFARALLHQPRVLLLDEATSSLDALTERHLYENLAGLDCTAIIIAHRLTTIRRADVILVMDEGRIVERGSHDQLMGMEGRYSALVAGHMPDEVAHG
jgi:ABC-type bacteriocin/lantibiotic exporter with double-glycine peptidase domain